jgi:ribose-phosphate pyrophosphokinase
MVRNIVVLGGSSHPQLVQTITNHLGVQPANVLLGKFSVGETRVEIKESVRGKDVYIIQSGCGKVNDNFMELLIAISACKTASCKQVTAVLPLFPYSRQSDIPYNKTGAPIQKTSIYKPDFPYTLDTAPQTPHPDKAPSAGIQNGNGDQLHKQLSKVQISDSKESDSTSPSSPQHPQINGTRDRSGTVDSTKSLTSTSHRVGSNLSISNGADQGKKDIFLPQPGYKQWVAQAGTLVADLLTCAGADHVITMDLHDAQYQGFFDIPVDNLYGRPLLKKYIQYHIPDYKNAVVVSPDAGGAKRATAIADSLGMPFALIHKVRTRS